MCDIVYHYVDAYDNYTSIHYKNGKSYNFHPSEFNYEKTADILETGYCKINTIIAGIYAIYETTAINDKYDWLVDPGLRDTAHEIAQELNDGRYHMIITEIIGYSVVRWNNCPGPLYDTYLLAHGEDGLSDMLFECDAVETTLLVYVIIKDGKILGKPGYVLASLNGKIVKPRGLYSSGWDRIFAPIIEGRELLTYAEMSVEMRLENSVRPSMVDEIEIV